MIVIVDLGTDVEMMPFMQICREKRVNAAVSVPRSSKYSTSINGTK